MTAPLPLGDLEARFAAELLSWLCRERVFGSIVLRNALMALQRYPAGRAVETDDRGAA